MRDAENQQPCRPSCCSYLYNIPTRNCCVQIFFFLGIRIDFLLFRQMLAFVPIFLVLHSMQKKNSGIFLSSIIRCSSPSESSLREKEAAETGWEMQNARML